VLGATGIIVEYAGASLESGGAKPRLAFHRSFRFALSLFRFCFQLSLSTTSKYSYSAAPHRAQLTLLRLAGHNMPADYYGILGVSKDATDAQLKTAYKKVSSCCSGAFRGS